MDESKVIVAEGHTTFVGPDAVQLYRAAVLRSGLKLLIKGIKPTRGMTLS